MTTEPRAAKKVYRSPELRVYGNVHELTQGPEMGTHKDGSLTIAGGKTAA